MKKLAASLAIATLAMFSTQAFAEGLYLKLDAGASVIKLPSNLFFANRGDAAPFVKLNNLDTDSGILAGFGIDLVMGSELPIPILGADGSKVELGGAFQNGWSSTSASFFDAGAGARYGWFELGNASGFGTFDGATLLTSTNRSLQYGHVEALLRNNYGSFEIFVGPELRVLNQKIDVTGTIGATSVSLAEVLTTIYGGATLGATIGVVDDGDWLVKLMGAVSLLGAHTQYSATYNDSIPQTQTASLSDQQIAVGAKVKLTVEKHITPNTTLGGYVSIDYLSYSPQVNYGSIPADPANGVLRLAGAPLFGGSVGATLRHKFK